MSPDQLRSRLLQRRGSMVIGGMQPSAAEIEMQARHIALRPARPPIRPVALEHHRGQPARHQSPRRGHPHARLHHDDVGVSGHGLQGRLSKRRLVIRPASGCFAPSRGTAESPPTRQSDLAHHFTSHRAASHRGRGQRSNQVWHQGRSYGTSSRADRPGSRERPMLSA